MNEKPTKNQRSLSRKYIAYKFLTRLFFTSAIWLYFYRLFVTDQQIGIIDGFAFAIGLLAEVPSGALADRFGRDRILRLGQILVVCGLLVQAFGSSFSPLFIGQATMMVGFSFISGADDALFFEKLNFDRASAEWRKLVTRGSQIGLFGALGATVVGGWLYSINPRIPWILSGLFFLTSTFIVWSIYDSRPKKSKQEFSVELRENLSSIKKGFMQFRSPELWLYVPIILTVQGLFYTAGWGMLRLVLLDRFNFDPFRGALAVATIALLTVGILALVHKYAEKLSEKHVLAAISLAAVAGLLFSAAPIGTWGYFVILVLYAGEHVLHPFMSEVLNKRALEGQRATVLSVASFLRTLPYVVLAPVIGYLNMENKLEYFLVIWAVLILVAVLVYYSLKKNDIRVNLTSKHAGVANS